MEQEFESVVLVKPGSSIFQYIEELKAHSWLALHVHPDHFTVDGAILFILQSTEERRNIEREAGKSLTPIKKVIFFDHNLVSKVDNYRLRYTAGYNSCLIQKYNGPAESIGSFEECFKAFKDGIDEVRGDPRPFLDSMGMGFMPN